MWFYKVNYPCVNECLTCCPGYSQVNSTATSCSPTTLQLTRRFSPTAAKLDEAWITGAGGAMGSDGKCKILVSYVM